MDIKEYNKVKNMFYFHYCKYLQDKYGVPNGNYCSPNASINKSIKRTKEGLFIHHIGEFKFSDLSKPDEIKANPYEYQKAENLVYCDYLEHLLLHIMIWLTFEQAWAVKVKNKKLCGIGGIVNHFVPTFNDLYSGIYALPQWAKPCVDKMIDKKDLYLMILSNLTDTPHCEELFPKLLLRSRQRDDEKCKQIYSEIEALFKEQKRIDS